MSITGESWRKYSNQERDNYAEFRAQRDGGDWRDWREEGKPRFKLYDPDKLKQAGYIQVEIYKYTAADGELLYEVLRWHHRFVPADKKFSMRMPNSSYAVIDEYFAAGGFIKVPYRWPDLKRRPNEPVWWTEGEKDADRLHEAGLLATTAAGQHWSPHIVRALAGRDVRILEDNDEAGRKNSNEAVRQAALLARSTKIIRLPGLALGEDVSDWLNAGNTIDDLKSIGDGAPSFGAATQLVHLNPIKLARRQWLYFPNYVRGSVSATIAPGGTAKTTLVINEALSMVTGKPILGTQLRRPLRVWYWNGEDPIEELHRRFAAARLHHGISDQEIGGRLYVDSGHTLPIMLAEESGPRGAVRVTTPAVEMVRKNILQNAIDVLILDPFVTVHGVSEGDNSKIKHVIAALRSIAIETNCSIMIVHHARKTGGAQATVEDSRGASAIIDAVRSARTLNRMTKAEASAANIREQERGWYLRADDGKLNMAPPAEGAKWFRLVSVDLGNCGDDGEFDEGDNVGVVASWEYPKEPEIIAGDPDIERALHVVRSGGPWRKDARAKTEPWIGEPIARALGKDAQDGPTRKRLKKLVEQWIVAGHLVVVQGLDKHRTKVPYVEAARMRGSAKSRAG